MLQYQTGYPCSFDPGLLITWSISLRPLTNILYSSSGHFFFFYVDEHFSVQRYIWKADSLLCKACSMFHHFGRKARKFLNSNCKLIYKIKLKVLWKFSVLQSTPNRFFESSRATKRNAKSAKSILRMGLVQCPDGANLWICCNGRHSDLLVCFIPFEQTLSLSCFSRLKHLYN